MPPSSPASSPGSSSGQVPDAARRRRARSILNRLTELYPEISTALRYTDPWQLLVATVLSAQTTDEMVNRVTPTLFERWPAVDDLANASPEEVEAVVHPTGFFRQKTEAIISLSQDLVEFHDGRVPDDLDKLVTLRGVGRKTASVVLAEAFGQPAIAVDTHVNRVTRRLGLTETTNAVKVEAELRALYPRSRWSGVSMRFIQFGRDVCQAKAPRCWECPLRRSCPYPDKAPAPG